MFKSIMQFHSFMILVCILDHVYCKSHQSSKRCTPNNPTGNKCCNHHYTEKMLYCDGMKLTKVPRINELQDLIPDRDVHPKEAKMLYWNGSLITSINNDCFEGYKSIVLLNFDLNQINEIEDEAFANLVDLGELVLSNNKIQNINVNMFKGLINLRTLNVANNDISKLDDDSFLNLNNLNSLDLSGNEIKEIISTEFRGLRELRILNCSGNDIVNIKRSLFTSTHKLEKIDFTNNKINSIDSNAFKILSHLRIILLSNNNLKYPNPSWFHKINIELEIRISLENNPWTCDENAEDYWHFLVKEGRKKADSFKIICGYPTKARGLTLPELTVFYESNNISLLRDAPAIKSTTTKVATTKVITTTTLLPEVPVSLLSIQERHLTNSPLTRFEESRESNKVLIVELTPEMIVILSVVLLVALVLLVLFIVLLYHQARKHLSKSSKENCKLNHNTNSLLDNRRDETAPGFFTRDSLGSNSTGMTSIVSTGSEISFLPRHSVPELFSTNQYKNDGDSGIGASFNSNSAQLELKENRKRIGRRHTSSCEPIEEEHNRATTEPKQLYEVPIHNNIESNDYETIK